MLRRATALKRICDRQRVQNAVYFYYIQKTVKFNVDFYSFYRYHVAYLRLILSESESCVTGAEMTKKNSNRATLRYYSLLLIG